MGAEKHPPINPLIAEKADPHLYGLLSLLQEHHAYTFHHCLRVSRSAMLLAQELELSHYGVVNIGIAGLLHDIGKICINPALLNKVSTTPVEYETLQKHVVCSRSILSQFPFPFRVLESAAYHHERLDGSGYPRGLKDREIPFPARILAVADVFDAITHDRHYRHGRPMEEALEILKNKTPRLFDPEVVGALEHILERTLPYKYQREYMQKNLATLVKKFPRDQVVALIFYSRAVKGFDYPQDLDVALITRNIIPEEIYGQIVDGNGWRCDDDLIPPALEGSRRVVLDPGFQRSIDVWMEPLDELLRALQGNEDRHHKAVPMPGSTVDNHLTPHKIAKLITEGVVIFYAESLKQLLGVEMLVDKVWHREIMRMINF